MFEREFETELRKRVDVMMDCGRETRYVAVVEREESEARFTRKSLNASRSVPEVTSMSPYMYASAKPRSLFHAFP